MARDEITLQYPTYDATDSVGSKKITKQAVTQANGIVLKNAFAGKDNSVVITIENTYTSADSTLTIKAGEKQNAKLGDCNVPLAKATALSGGAVAPTVTEVRINRDMARFERLDGSIYLDFASGFTGNIWATAEKAGL